MKERLDKLIVVFKVRKKGVDSEELWGTGEESREDLDGEEVADVGAVYGEVKLGQEPVGLVRMVMGRRLQSETGAQDLGGRVFP